MDEITPTAHSRTAKGEPTDTAPQRAATPHMAEAAAQEAGMNLFALSLEQLNQLKQSIEEVRATWMLQCCAVLLCILLRPALPLWPRPVRPPCFDRLHRGMGLACCKAARHGPVPVPINPVLTLFVLLIGCVPWLTGAPGAAGRHPAAAGIPQ